MTIPVVLTISALVAGCTSLTAVERRAHDAATCRGYGFAPRTQGFAECLQRIDLSRDADRRAWRYNDPYYRGGLYRPW